MEKEGESGSAERKRGRYRPKRDKERDGGRRGRKNLLRHAWGKLSLWQGRGMPLHSTNAMADYWEWEEERKQRKEQRRQREEEVVQWRDIHEPRGEERSSLCSLSLLGFSYFSARHYSPGTWCEQLGDCVCVCLRVDMSVSRGVYSAYLCGWQCVCAAMKACACSIRFKAKWWNTPLRKQKTNTNTHTHWQHSLTHTCNRTQNTLLA